MADASQVHGSAVAVEERGLLILGASGSGKSALAASLIAQGADLVADDRVEIAPDGAGGLLLSAPGRLSGLIEVRGFGLIRLRARAGVPLALAVDLDEAETERLPPRRVTTFSGISCPVLLGRGRPDLPALVTCILRATDWIDPERFMPCTEEDG